MALGLVAAVEISPGVNVGVAAKAAGTSKEKTEPDRSLIVQTQGCSFSPALRLP
jgi:hypothetical protein